MREYKTHKHFSMPFRVDGPSSADLGIALFSHDGGSISAISLVEWSPSTLAGKRRAKFLDITLLPPVSLAELGQPRATIVELLVLSDDRCDAGTRDVAASAWPSLRESLCRRDSRWLNAITMIELHLWLHVVERGDGARVVALLDRGADPNAYLERTEQLETGESVKLYRTETVTRRETVLERAVRCGCRGVAEILLERGALASADALGHAVRGNDVELVRRLLDRGADPNGLVWTTEHVQEYYGYDSGEVTVHLRVPAVVLASQVGNRALFLLLVAAGGRPGKEVSTRVLLEACRTRDLEAVRPVVEVAERLGITLEPLGVARQGPAIFGLVLEVAERQGTTLEPLDVAREDPAVFRLVLERRWRLHPESTTAESRRVELTPCLMSAIGKCSTYDGERDLKETVDYLLLQGADADFFDPSPRRGRHVSPLHEAFINPYRLDLVQLLLEHGARTTFAFEDGYHETALEIAQRTLRTADLSRTAEMLSHFEQTRTRGQG